MNGVERFICIGDNHGDMIDPGTEKVLFEFIKDFKPHKRYHLGDCFDFRWLRTRASEQEKRENISEDVDSGIEFLTKFKPDLFFDGNHEFRIRNACESDDGKLKALARNIVKDIGVILGDAGAIPYDKEAGVYRVGDLALMHGYFTGLNAARQCAMTYGKSAMAHVHSSDTARAPRHDHAVGHTIGCIGKTAMPYNATQPGTLRQNNGWGFGIKLSNGTTIFNHAKKESGRWIIPTDFKEYRAS